MAAPQTQKNDGAIDAEWRRKEDGEIGELEGTGVGGRKGKGKREELCDAGDDGERERKGKRVKGKLEMERSLCKCEGERAEGESVRRMSGVMLRGKGTNG